MQWIYLSLGSNIGNRKAHLDEAVNAIKALDVHIEGQSKDYLTEPQGYINQDYFENRCLVLSTDLEPMTLLLALQKIETDLKRARDLRWGPRTIDIDIIWVEGFESDDPVLTIPHPRAFERAFVVKPLYDLPRLDPNLKTIMDKVWPEIAHQGVRESTYEY